MLFQLEAQVPRSATADPFTRRRCAPTLVTKVRLDLFLPMIELFLLQAQLNNKEDLLQKLQQERKAAEAAVATKKDLDEQQLAVRRR